MHSIVREIEGLNQRGGRMLTAPDLILAGTADLPLMAFLMRRIHHGASILTCAGPGGTGKTTLLGTLLCFLPVMARLQVVERAKPAAWYAHQAEAGTVWFLCHELGKGPYYSYLWGAAAKSFLEAPARHSEAFCATTVHADSIQELKAILQGPAIGLSSAAFSRLDLIIFMQAVSCRGRIERRITAVYAAEPDTAGKHVLVCRWDPQTDAFRWPDPITSPSDAVYAGFLQSLIQRNLVTAAAVRSEVEAFYRSLENSR